MGIMVMSRGQEVEQKVPEPGPRLDDRLQDAREELAVNRHGSVARRRHRAGCWIIQRPVECPRRVSNTPQTWWARGFLSIAVRDSTTPVQHIPA